MWTTCWTSVLTVVMMAEAGILDTSVIIDLPMIPDNLLPDQASITTVTLAELAAGPHATIDVVERSIRQQRLQWAESTFDAFGFDSAAARAYGRIYALVRAANRQPRGRLADLLIASIASSQRLSLYTRNPADFTGLDSMIEIVTV